VRAIKFGKVLRQMRKEAGMSQEDIALDLHMSISNVSRLESDKYQLKAVDLIRWADATNATDSLIALIIGVDVAIVQQILETLPNIMMIFLGG